MRLTTRDLTQLPFGAQALDLHGNVIAHTPEWGGGGGMDTVQFRAGGIQLLVETDVPDATIAALCARVLDEVDALAEH